MLRAIAFGIGLCAVFALVLYVYYSGDTVPRPGSAEQPANYRALAKLTWIDFSLVSPQVGWLLLGNTQNFPEDGRILTTRDGGDTWYAQLSGPIRMMQFVDENDGWAFVFSGHQLTATAPTPEKPVCQCLMASHDGGRSWQQLPPPPDYLQNFRFVNDHVGWPATGTTDTAGFHSGVVRTTDGGVSWQAMNLPSEIASSPAALLDAKGERTSWLSFCLQGDCSRRALAVTYDGGSTWKSLASPCPSSPGIQDRLSQYFVGYFLSESEWWILCRLGDRGGAALYRTSDGGAQWVPLAQSTGAAGLPALPPLLSPSGGWSHIGFVNPNDGWITIGGASGGPFVTHDGGMTWKDTRPLDVAANTASFLHDKYGWALTGSSLLSTDDGGASWHQIYPPKGR